MSQSETSEGPFTYYCTITKSCGLDFDSYQDWYDHETTARPNQLEFWYCEEWTGHPEDEDEGPCDQGFYIKADSVAHFEEDHKKIDEPQINLSLIGPTHGLRYWCGFCTQVHDIEDTFEERYRHIRFHYEGKDAFSAFRLSTGGGGSRDWIDR